MTNEEIDAQERAAFVKWRQKLAKLEEEEHLVLTPFEKNLEVWRQLWRVLERSHIVIQVSSCLLHPSLLLASSLAATSVLHYLEFRQY